MKIASQLNTAFTGLALAATLVLGSAVYLIGHQILLRYAEAHLQAVADVQLQRIRAILEQNRERLLLVADGTPLRTSLRQFQETGDIGARDRVQRILVDTRDRIADFQDLRVLDDKGRILISTKQGEAGRIHDLAPGRLDGDVSIRVDRRHRSDRGDLFMHLVGRLSLEGRRLGLLVIDATPDKLLRVVQDFSGLGRSGETVLAEMGADDWPLLVTRTRSLPDPTCRDALPTEAFHSPMLQVLGDPGVRWVDGRDCHGIPVMAATRHIQPLGWGLVVKMDREEVFEPLDHLLRWVLVALAAVVALVVLVSRRIARGFAVPLNELMRTAERLAGGDLSSRSRASGSAETQALARVFNGMADELESANLELERRVVERTREAQASEALANQIIEQAPEALLLVNEEARIVRLNAHAEQVLGYRREELLGESVECLVPERYREAHRGHVASYNLRPRVLTISPDLVFSARRKDGSEFPASIGLAPLGDALDRQVVVTLVDLTRQHQMESELRRHRDHLEERVAERTRQLQERLGELEQARSALQQQEELLRNAKRLARLGNWYWELSGDRHTWSEEIYHIYGRDPDLPPTVYPEVQDYFTPESWQRLSAAVQAGIDEGRPYECDAEVVRPDGGRRWITARGQPVRDAEGRVVALYGTVQDITERKQSEQALIEARERARAADRAKGEFLANMSHEIRTPINAVLGLARIGARDSRGRAAGDTFRRILDAGEYLLGVINDILDLSRLEAGKLGIERRPFALAGVLADAGNLVAPQMRDKGLVLVLESPAHQPDWVYGDAQRLRQILVNLLSNAVKFTQEGRVRLRVAVAGADIHFHVEDTGIGIEASRIPHLFDAFVQADSSTTRRFGGSGLGLAISRHLAGLMDGDIRVESAPGAGSTFTLRLPLPAAEAPTPARGPSVDTTPGEPRLRGLHLLSADDLPDNRFIVEDLLRHEGARVTLAENGRQALEQIQAQGASRFDAVLMDIQMPEMDGYEATRRIHALAPGLPVIGLTAHALVEERERCLAAGMCAHVTKPIEPEELVAAILQCTAVVHPAVQRAEEESAAEPAADLDSASPGTPPRAYAGLIDQEALLARFNGRRGFIDKLKATVRAGHADGPRRLRAAADAGDLETLAFLAHGIKGVGGNLAAPGLRSLARDVVEAARSGDAGAPALARRLADRMDRLLEELRP